MFAIRVQAVFSAAHALVIGGVREPLHGHDWHVTATLVGTTLDADGLLWDFHALEADLRELIAPFQNQNLNETRTFGERNPSAEAVAQNIGEGLTELLRTRLARYPKSEWSQGLRIERVEVTEAPGCVAEWRARAPTDPAAHGDPAAPKSTAR
ncbi:MAG: 6-pyruvoyl tetrahydropterin synthase family protein [Phycisphaerales bacterium]